MAECKPPLSNGGLKVYDFELPETLQAQCKEYKIPYGMWFNGDASPIYKSFCCCGPGYVNGCGQSLNETGNPLHFLFYEDDNPNNCSPYVFCAACAKKHGMDVPKVTTHTPTDGPEVVVLPENFIGVGKFTPAGLAKSYSKAVWHTIENCPQSVKAYSCQPPTGSACYTRMKDTPRFLLFYHKHGTPSGSVYCEKCANAVGYYYKSPMLMDENAMPLTICLGCKVRICNVCTVCHEESCDFYDKYVVHPEHLTRYSYLRAKTQKVRGYVALAEAGIKVPSPYKVIISDDDISNVVDIISTSARTFVRPCPTRPRHGFVDSREVDTSNIQNQLQEMLIKSREADETGHAELLIVPYIDSALNMIITPTRVAVGPGHDGATAGHTSTSFPLAGVPFAEVTETLLKKSRIGADEDPYIEAVMSKESNQVFFTQLRAGVKIPPSVGKDFVPERVRVEEVIEASGDLLEWEAQTKRIKPGSVVVHIGGTLISHYGVHCIFNKIPVMTTRKPDVGEVLEIEDRVVRPNPAAVIRGLAGGVNIPLNLGSHDILDSTVSVRNALVVMMGILHNAAAMGEDEGYWIGVATAIMMRCGMAASHGEARHKIGYYNRATVHKAAFDDFFVARDTLGCAQWKFRNLTWGGSYGGPKWADCTSSILQLDDDARDLINNPSDAAVVRMVSNLNVAINKAHNGGWWMNKFIDKSAFDKAATQSLSAVAQAAAVMYILDQRRNSTPYMATEELLAKWGAAPKIVERDEPLQIELVQPQAAKTKQQLKQKASEPSGTWDSIGKNIKDYEIAIEDATWICLGCKENYGKDMFPVTKYILGGKPTPVCGGPEPGCANKLVWVTSDGAIHEWKGSESDHKDSDNEDSEDSDEPCDCDDCIADKEKQEHVAAMKSNPMDVHGNVNDTIGSIPGAEVTAAQAILKVNGPHLYGHLQYKTDKTSGYYSCDFQKTGPLPAGVTDAAIAKLPNCNTFSGSGNNIYKKLTVCPGMGATYLQITELSLTVWLNPATNYVEKVTWDSGKLLPIEPKPIIVDSISAVADKLIEEIANESKETEASKGPNSVNETPF